MHDYLSQRGGAERVVLAMARAFPGAPIYTALYEPTGTYPEFADLDVRPLWPNRVAPLRRRHRLAFPLLARTFSGTRLDDFDVVLCSSSGWSHGVQSSGRKVVYCYTPARWLYLADDYVRASSWGVKLALRIARGPLVRWDQRQARSVDVFLTSSTVVASRIHQTYGRSAQVIPPPVGLTADGPISSVAGVEPGFLLTVARPRTYKNVELVCQAVSALAGTSLVVVGGSPGEDASGRIHSFVDLDDAQMRWLYANCRAVVAAAFEDFGLSPVEGFAFGKPAVALRAGGFLDTVTDGVTGVFFDRPEQASLVAALVAVQAGEWNAELIKKQAEQYETGRFEELLRAAVMTEP